MIKMKISTLWAYRVRKEGTTNFGPSVQVYNAKVKKWVHMFYIQSSDLEAAKARYNETMRYASVHMTYLKFSYNHLLELHRAMEDPRLTQHFRQTDVQEIKKMLKAVCHILKIELEIV